LAFLMDVPASYSISFRAFGTASWSTPNWDELKHRSGRNKRHMSPHSNPEPPEVRLAHYSNALFSRGRSRFTEALWLLSQWALASSWIAGSAHRRWLLRALAQESARESRSNPASG
jgi:hypothetical protein